MPQPRFRIHAPFARANDGGARIKQDTDGAMTEKEERLARDRAEIAARVASFRETQQKFERAREEYYETTLGNALNGSGRPSFWRWDGTGRSLIGLGVITEGIWRVEPQANAITKCRRESSPWQERSRRFGVFLSSAATLREVKAWKTPSASSNAGGVFHYGADGLRPHAIASHAIGRVWSSDYAGTNTALAEFSCGERCVMPVWLEILINVIGYAGFIAVATYHRSPNEKFPEWKIPGSLSAELSGVQFALCGTPAVRTSLSALTSTWLLSACGRNEKLTTTKARQNSRPTIMTRRWVGLSALWNEGTMACFPFGHPYRNSEYAQRDLGFNLTE
jgi:hypothetical protein